MTNIVNDLREAIVKRISDPILGPFTIFFLLVNWKIPLFLVFGTGNRIVDIETYFNSHSLCITLGIPILLAFFYIGAWPWAVVKTQTYLADIKKKGELDLNRVAREGVLGEAERVELQKRLSLIKELSSPLQLIKGDNFSNCCNAIHEISQIFKKDREKYYQDLLKKMREEIDKKNI